MEQFVWSMEGEPVKDLFRYVLMESGDMCVDMVGILILTMQEWCVANWDTLQQVFMFMNYCSTIIILLGNSVYSASYNMFSGSNSPQPIILAAYHVPVLKKHCQFAVRMCTTIITVLSLESEFVANWDTLQSTFYVYELFQL